MSVDPYRYFRVEAHDLLDELRRGALELSRGESAAAAIKRLLRAAHTLKSAARVVRLKEVGDRAHALEDLLAPFRDQDAPVPADVSEALAEHLAAIVAGLAVIDAKEPSEAATSAASASRERGVEDLVRVVRADIADVDELVEGLGTVHVELAGLRESLDETLRLRDVAELLATQLTMRASGAVETRATARSLAEDLRAALVALERRLGRGLERVTRELGQARESAERLRLSPASVLLDALERTALDAGRALGRRVTFRAIGGEVRLDAHVLALAQGALVQIVRNAVAHGIEGEPERRRAGKPIEGLVEVTVERQASRIRFTCRDDGRGVDVDAVRRAARRKGSQGVGIEEKSAAELLGMLLGGGLSTSRDVNAIAGRGVGMDVVRSAAERLGGEVQVRTNAGHGTEIELRVPILLSALDVLLVSASGRTFGLALDTVRGTRRVEAREIARGGEGASLVDGPRVIPYATLARCLDLPEDVTTPAHAESAVVVETDGDAAAIGVDRLLGISHVLLRPVPELAPSDGSVAGVAIDASGDALMVLDTARIARRARRAPRRSAEPSARLPILVVDDSLTTRMLEQSILEAAGYRVDLASSGEDALDKLAAARFGLALVDVEMPGIDGFEVIRRIRADPSTRELPAILVTSRNAPEDRALGREVGASDYVVKGEFDQARLLERIRELWRGP